MPSLSFLFLVGDLRAFCNSCYLGVVSAGDAGGEGSELRRIMLQEVLRSSVFDEFSKNHPQAYLATSRPIWQSRLWMPVVPDPQYPNTLLKDIRRMSDVKDSLSLVGKKSDVDFPKVTMVRLQLR